MAYAGVLQDFRAAIAGGKPARMPALVCSEESPGMLATQVAADFSIINCGPGIDMQEARQAVGPEQCLSGNVDPIETLMRGSPEQVSEEVSRIIETVSSKGAHIMCSGEMVPRDTPEENLAAFVQATRDAWARVGGG